MLRAQTAAASLSAALEVMTRFVAASLQGGQRSAFENEVARIASTVAVAEAAPAPVPPQVHAVEAPASAAAAEMQHEIQAEVHTEPLELAEPAPAPHVAGEPESEGDFDVHRLSSEEQELHRRANRVAKVSMQDIKMLRPEQVRLGRESKDLCIRLKDDIEKAHREYDRRFKPIMDHPVDYFYRWMVEILAEGDPHALGEYPYATPARHH